MITEVITHLLINGKTRETLHRFLEVNHTVMKLLMEINLMIKNSRIKMITEIKLSMIMVLLINGRDMAILHSSNLNNSNSSKDNIK